MQDSNSRPDDYKSTALPTELIRHTQDMVHLMCVKWCWLPLSSASIRWGGYIFTISSQQVHNTLYSWYLRYGCTDKPHCYSGATKWDRTTGLRNRNPTLFHLSYGDTLFGRGRQIRTTDLLTDARCSQLEGLHEHIRHRRILSSHTSPSSSILYYGRSLPIFSTNR